MKISDLYKRLLNGEKFKGINDINLERLPVKHAADLVGSSPIMQQLAEKHSKNLKHNSKKKPL